MKEEIRITKKSAKKADDGYKIVSVRMKDELLERLEALIVSLWLFPDFLLVSALLYSAQHCLRCLLGEKPEFRGESRFDLSRGRWVIPLCGALSITAAILIAPDASSMTQWSERTIPIINLAVSFGFIPMIYIIGRLRKKM